MVALPNVTSGDAAERIRDKVQRLAVEVEGSVKQAAEAVTDSSDALTVCDQSLLQGVVVGGY